MEGRLLTKTSLKSAVLAIIKSRTINNPIRSGEIKRKLGCAGANIREAVNELRAVDHLPVCSGSSGYYYPLDKTEAIHTINHLRSRARAEFKAAEGILKHYESAGQMELV